MYSESVIQKTLSDFAHREGWMPEPHSIEQIEEFDEYVNSLIETEEKSNTVNTYFKIKDGLRLTQARRDWHKRWIQNEQYLCFADANYFLTRYAFICGVGEEIFRYKPRDSQKILHSVFAEADEQQIAIEIMALKARQLGISTAVAAYFMHRLLFRPNTRGVMASVQQKQSDLIGRIQNTIWNKLPFWLPPAKTVTKTSSPEWANGSILSIQSGSQAFGIAQGWTPSLVHISELSDIPNPKKVLEEGLYKAAHSTRNLFFVMEGTGGSDTGWMAEKWAYYKENWGKGGRFRPIFIPPACAKDLYPLPDWVRAHPIPEGWRPMEETKRMQHKSELYVRSTDYLAKAMGGNWKMGREYMWFWECNWREAVASHTEKVWLSQMACSDLEAMQGVNDTVFREEVIEIVTRESERAYTPYAVTGKTILIGSDNRPYEPPLDEIDYDAERIPIHLEAPDGNKYDWELVPLKQFDDSTDEACFNKLLIFNAPKEGDNYAIGVDTAHGLAMPNEDRSTCCVLKEGTGKNRDVEMARFTSNAVNSAQMARIAACLATLYGTDGAGNITTEDPMGCKFVIEQIRKAGDECQLQLKNMGFYNHHLMVFYDNKGVIDPNRGYKEGFRTSAWSRPMLLSKFVDAVNSGWIQVNDPITIRQMRAFVRITDGGGRSIMGHPSGSHDDNIFAIAMAHFTMHHLENSTLRQEQRYRSEEDKNKSPNLGWASQNITID